VTSQAEAPTPEPEPAPADTVPEPAQAALRSEVDSARRSARYALVTAVSAAVISSAVSAGAAVYTSVNQADRGDRLALSQALRADRQSVYHDFSLALFSCIQEISAFSGQLQAGQSMASVREQVAEVSRKFNEFSAGLNLLLMTGSADMQDVGNRFATTFYAFANDHFRPLVERYLSANAPGANDIAGWQRDSAATVAAGNDFLTKVGDLNAAFVEQGSKDLR